jgi:putative Ca2+/H+ antiporter (TMEM165/GDT1 family)
VHARPGSGALSQFLLVFLAEAVTGEAAAAIALAARTDVPPSVARLGLAAGRVCAVVVAASASQGVPSSEDARSLSRFEPGISELLNLSAGP